MGRNNQRQFNYYPKIRLLTTKSNDENIKYIISKEKVENLRNCKNQIDEYYNDKLWDKIKKNTNPYEIIYITNKKSRRHSVAKYEPLSRSYFKMIEIAREFFNDVIEKNQNIISVHLAEGPGGFIEAIVNMRRYRLQKKMSTYRSNTSYKKVLLKHQDSEDKVYGMTLISKNKEIPGWNRSMQFLNNNKNVFILTGMDGTGDLYNLKNILLEFK